MSAFCSQGELGAKYLGYQKAEVLKGFDAGTTLTPLRGVSMSVRLQMSCGQVGHVRYLSCLSST